MEPCKQEKCWLEGEEMCPFCCQCYVWESGSYCAGCDHPVCPQCALILAATGEAVCPVCAASEPLAGDRSV